MNLSGSKWTDEELAVVRAMYPTEPWADILKALKGRTEKGIANAAVMIGVKRLRKPYRGSEKAKARIARATAKRSAKRADIARRQVGSGAKMAAARRKAGLSGAEAWAHQARIREAQDMPCEPGTCRASNGVTLAKPGQAHLYNERRF